MKEEPLVFSPPLILKKFSPEQSHRQDACMSLSKPGSILKEDLGGQDTDHLEDHNHCLLSPFPTLADTTLKRAAAQLSLSPSSVGFCFAQYFDRLNICYLLLHPLDVSIFLVIAGKKGKGPSPILAQSPSTTEMLICTGESFLDTAKKLGNQGEQRIPDF